jgi:hypothetical protein
MRVRDLGAQKVAVFAIALTKELVALPLEA